MVQRDKTDRDMDGIEKMRQDKQTQMEQRDETDRDMDGVCRKMRQTDIQRNEERQIDRYIQGRGGRKDRQIEKKRKIDRDIQGSCLTAAFSQALTDMMNKSSEFVQRARDAPPELQFFTDVEIDTMDKLITDTQVSCCKVLPVFLKIFQFVVQFEPCQSGKHRTGHTAEQLGFQNK